MKLTKCGTSILALTKNPSNPIIPTVNGTWCAGTAGKRSSLIKTASNFYYMAYEGSTAIENGSYATSDWSTGLARSVNKTSWAVYSGNPIVPVVQNSMGNDGPELIIINGSTYLYVRSPSGGGMDRYKLVWN